MRTKTGVLGVCLMVLGALAASSANTKTAAARPSPVKPFTVIQAPAQKASASSALARASNAPQALVSVAAPVEIITPPPADPNLENPQLRRMRTQEITKGMLETAAKIVHEHHAKPVGTLIEVDVSGKRVIARIERHFHPEGGALKPWGFHPGVSLFAFR